MHNTRRLPLVVYKVNSSVMKKVGPAHTQLEGRAAESNVSTLSCRHGVVR
jgi:hypothetical protein